MTDEPMIRRNMGSVDLLIDPDTAMEWLSLMVSDRRNKVSGTT